jgi:hypothetical protein
MITKIWKATLTAEAKMAVTQDAAYVIGSPNRFIKVNENGTTIYGPVSIVAGTESIKTGGLFTSLPNLVKMIPSTTFSPIPDQIPSPPLNIAFDLVEDVSFFAALLG